MISEEEYTTPFFACPCPFPVLMWVPSCDSNKVKKSENHIPNPLSHCSSIHDSNSMEEIPEWIMKPMVKTNSSILQDDLTVHKSSLNSCYPLSLHALALYCDFPNQSTPPTSFSHSLDFRVAGSNCDKVQGNHFTQAQEQEYEDAPNIFYFCQDPPCQDYVPPFLGDFQSTNLGSESNVINSFNQFVALENNPSNDDDFIDACNHECLGPSADILFS